jgi:uncharacterized SAM-binding protein YcdF (DUF218 family)
MPKGSNRGFILLGSILSLAGIYMLSASNFNLGLLFCLLAGLLVLAAGVFAAALNKFFRGSAVGRLCRAALLLGGGVILLTAGCITVTGLNDNVDFKEDAVIILGAGVRGETVSLVLAERLDAGVEYHRLNPQARIVVSGGQGPQENITEALAMQRYLLARGVPSELILLEEKATSTRENFRYAAALLDDTLGNRAYRVAYITNYFHAYRAGLTARAEGLDATHYSAGMPLSSILPNYLREIPAVWVTWLRILSPAIVTLGLDPRV